LMDGFAVLRRLRQDPHYAALPIAAITAYAMAGDRQRALAAGFDDYIAKPIHPASFRACISKLLAAKHLKTPSAVSPAVPPRTDPQEHEPR
jgi:CheY-like chemotaxis protein